MHRRSLRSNAGFTMIEVMVAATVLVTGILGTLTIFDRASKTTVETRAREGATSLARELTEAARGVQYERIAQTTLAQVLADQPGLEDARPGTPEYEVDRRGILYSISLYTCVMDDARDGGGAQDPTTQFCEGSAPANSAPSGGVSTAVDRNPEDYKQVRVTVAWTKNHMPRTVSQDVIVNNPGSSAGPAVRQVTLQGLTAPIITNGTQVRVLFETTSRPASTNWLVDAAVQTPKPTASGTRSFYADWNYAALEDGTYVLGAEAFDKYGVAGQSKSLSVKLNRFRAKAPTGLAGGRNGDGLVELAWAANIEKDIVGYSVERSTDNGMGWFTVCAMAQATSCLDRNPPAPGNDQVVLYRVRAWDSGDNGAPREGLDTSEPLRLPESNEAPAAPLQVEVRQLADGTAQLTWKRPADDPRDPVAFYRVYRDGQAVEDRYATTNVATATVQFLDTGTGGVPHSYHVTAVDGWYLESAKVRAEEAN